MKRSTMISAALVLFTLSLFSESALAQRRVRRRPVFVNRNRHQKMMSREMLGIRVGNDFDNEQYFAGAQLWIPAGIFWRFVPSFDYHFVDEKPDYTRWQFNGDLFFQPRPLGLLYFGGGLAVNYILPDKGENTTEFGGNAIVGLQTSMRRPMSFFVQARWSFFDETFFSVLGGINLSLR